MRELSTSFSTSWRLLTAVGVLTVATVTTALVRSPFVLPGWLSWATGPDRVAARPPEVPLLPDFSVAVGDRSLRVTLPPGTDARPYQVDAVSETNLGTPGSCLVADTGSPSGPGCTIEGLRDGIDYLVSLRRAGSPGGAPARMKHVTPSPDLLRGPDLVAWYDAADYGSVRPDQRGPARVGSRVVVLRDKSSRHADATQSDQGAMPVVGQLGPNPALQLGSSSHLAADERGLPQGGHPATVIAVAAQDDPGPGNSCFRTLLAWGSASDNHARILEKGCHTDLAFAETFNSWRFQTPTAAWPQGRATVVSSQFDKEGTSIWLDHRLSLTWRARGDTVTNTTVGGGLVLGAASWNDAAGWIGRIGEVIIFDRALEPEERRSVELYLSAKWQVLLAPDSSPSSS